MHRGMELLFPISRSWWYSKEDDVWSLDEHFERHGLSSTPQRISSHTLYVPDMPNGHYQKDSLPILALPASSIEQRSGLGAIAQRV